MYEMKGNVVESKMYSYCFGVINLLSERAYGKKRSKKCLLQIQRILCCSVLIFNISNYRYFVILQVLHSNDAMCCLYRWL